MGCCQHCRCFCHSYRTSEFHKTTLYPKKFCSSKEQCFVLCRHTGQHLLINELFDCCSTIIALNIKSYRTTLNSDLNDQKKIPRSLASVIIQHDSQQRQTNFQPYIIRDIFFKITNWGWTPRKHSSIQGHPGVGSRGWRSWFCQNNFVRPD